MTAFDNVRRIFRSESFRRIAGGFDRRLLIHKANEVGPRMRLLHCRRLEELGRLPSFDDGLTDDAISGIDRFGASTVEIFMVSHRWLRPSLDARLSHPDDSNKTKAKALIEFTKWRRNWVRRRHGFELEIFYWVDYCCFDQRDVANYLPMLPLWVACCERMVRYETPDYHNRAWCRLELLLSHAFAFADHHVAIGGGFVASGTNNGSEEKTPLQRPSEGVMTDDADAAGITLLEQFAEEFEPATVDRITRRRLAKAKFGQTTISCYRL